MEPTVAAENRSSSVRSFRLPDGVDYRNLHDALKRDGYVIYAGLGDAAKSTFRVCTLGALGLDVLSDFVESLERALVEARLSNTADRRRDDAVPARDTTSAVPA
jgi:2-aminoethylphosphonate-pyruvate transaminase